MNKKTFLKCIKCNQINKIEKVICPTCKGVYSTLSVKYGSHKKETSVNNLYKTHLPFSLFKSSDFHNCSLKKIKADIWAKNESENPSGSVKEKEIQVAIKVAKYLKKKKLSFISSGSGINVCQYFNQKLQDKILLIKPKGKDIKLDFAYKELGNNYEEAFKKTIDFCQEIGYWNITPGINPYSQEGAKVISWQIISSGVTFDQIVVPCGNGSLLWGIYKGFKEAYDSSLINKIPIINGVELENGPIGKSYKTGLPEKNIAAKNSKATSIDVLESFCLQKVIIALKDTGGKMITLQEGDIEDAYKQLNKLGYSVCHSAAAGFAGTLKIQNKFGHSKICCVLTAKEY